MAIVLFALLLLASPNVSSDDPEACVAIGPDSVPPPVASLEQAREYWGDGSSVPRDTLRSHLSRVLQARSCYLSLDSTEVARSYAGRVVGTFTAEATLRAALRQFTDAFEAYESGLSYLESRPETVAVEYEAADGMTSAHLHEQEAYLYFLIGNLSASIKHYLSAYRLSTRAPQRAKHLINVGILLQRVQDYRSAQQYYERAERLIQQNNEHADESGQRARLLHTQADLMLEKTLNTVFSREPLERARQLAQRARPITEPGTELRARVTMALSESLGYLGAFDRAYSLNAEVRRFAEDKNKAELQAFALLKLGVLHMQTEKSALADSSLHDALTLSRNLRDLDYQRRILRALGRLHEMQKEWSAAERYYREGVDVIEEYRSSLTASQWSMTAFAQWRDVHRGLVRTLLAQDQNRAALAALDRSRARHLRDLRTQARVAEDLPAEASARLDSLSRTLTNVRNQLAASSLPSADEARLRHRETSLMAARQQLLQMGSTSDRSSLDTISEALAQEGRVLVSYFLDDPWPVYDRSPRSVAFVVTPDTLRTVSLNGVTQDSVEAQLEAISGVFSSRGKVAQVNDMQFDLRPLHRLHNLVYAPVETQLPDGRPLTVIPDGPLYRLPFSMLVHSMPNSRYAPSEARFLLHRRSTTHELTSSLVPDSATAVLPDSPAKSTDLAAFGVSKFDSLETVLPALRASMPRAALDSTISVPPLPGVRAELGAVRQRVAESRVFLDEAATEETFRRVSPDAGVLHLASHAFVHPSSPLQNAFLLHPDSARSGHDGLLFLHELQNRRRPFSLVVLSGCNTARGTLRGGEGMEGLQYAFRAMGAQATVSSLWPVADDANVALMDAFYGFLREGLSKDRALRRAKMQFLEAHPEQASPFFWAATVLYGSPSPLPLESPSLLSSWAWGALGLSFGAAVSLLVWRRRDLVRLFRGS